VAGVSPAIRFVGCLLAKNFGAVADCGLLLNPAESASPENNRQPEQDHCDRQERRTGDVSEQDEEDRDDGEDCCDVVVHGVPIVYLVRLSGARLLNNIEVACG